MADMDHRRRCWRSRSRRHGRGSRRAGIPIGAALFDASGALLGRGHNQRVQRGDPSAHGETDAFRNAGRRRSYRDTIMVTTLVAVLVLQRARPPVRDRHGGDRRVAHVPGWDRVAARVRRDGHRPRLGRVLRAAAVVHRRPTPRCGTRTSASDWSAGRRVRPAGQLLVPFGPREPAARRRRTRGGPRTDGRRSQR